MEDKLKKDIKNPEKNAEFIKEFGGLPQNPKTPKPQNPFPC